MTTSSLRDIDRAHVWHPFTAMAAFVDECAPIIAEAEGFHLIDTTGRRYLDGHSSLWCNIHGHRVSEIDQALQAQLQQVAHTTLLGLSNVPSIELAAELVRRVPPGLTKVFYADCGAAGVEVALKMAYQFHRQKPRPEPRDLFVGLAGAYHGDTVGTVSLGGIERFHSLFSGLMFPTLRIPSPATPGLSLQDCLRETERILSAQADRIAGVIVEPLVQAAAGILVHPPEYLRSLRDMTHKFGTLLIADEIAVGFGRTGTLFACEQAGITPDMMILSKGLTGGYLPLAATLATEEIYAAFLGAPWSGRAFLHGHTYTGNPLACAAALASLRLIDAHGVLENVRRIEACLREDLILPLSGGREAPGGVPNTIPAQETSTPLSGASRPPLGTTNLLIRHQGVMLGIELLRDAHPLAPVPFRPEKRIGHQVVLACRQRGVIVRNIGDVVVVMPAPAMPVDSVRQLCHVVSESIDEVVKQTKNAP